MEAEQVELHAQLAVVALLRLLAPPQVLVQLLLALPDRAVDPLEHRALLVASPVGAGDREQLERADVPRGVHVRALAQVPERAVLVEGHRRQRLARLCGLAGEVVEDLDLERPGRRRPRVARPSSNGDLPADEGVVGGHGGAHPALDGREVVGRERRAAARSRSRSRSRWRGRCPACAREQVEDRLGHHVRRAVAHRVDGGVGARVEQLVRRAAVWAPRTRTSSSSSSCPAACPLSSAIASLPRITEPLVPTGREVRPPAVPPAFASPDGPVPRSRAALTGGSRAGSPAARGWCLGPSGPGRGSQPVVASLWRVRGRAWPGRRCMVGDTGLEPVTSCMSSMRANQLRQSPV